MAASTFSLSAQRQSPKIVWKNLQANYEHFQDVKPIIKNESDQPIYFNCSDSDYGSFPAYSYDEKFKLLRNVSDNKWDWNVIGCGTRSLKELKEIKRQKQKNEKLKNKANIFLMVAD
jgi:hypothetical protein